MEGAALTVVTYNVRGGIGPGPFPPAWWTHIDDARVAAIGAYLKSVGPDVVCLQEVALASVNGRAIDQPAQFGRLTGLDYRYGAVAALPLVEPEPSGRTVGAYLWGNMVLSRFPIVGAVTHALPVALDDPADRIDTEPRCALACVLDTPAGPLSVISTHLAWLGARARAPQATRLAEVAADGGRPLVLGGDLNAPLEAVELSAVRGLLDDCFSAAGVPEGDERRESCGTDRIDHVLVAGWETVECRVAREAGDLSDHWPVIARLRRR